MPWREKRGEVASSKAAATAPVACVAASLCVNSVFSFTAACVTVRERGVSVSVTGVLIEMLLTVKTHATSTTSVNLSSHSSENTHMNPNCVQTESLHVTYC